MLTWESTKVIPMMKLTHCSALGQGTWVIHSRLWSPFFSGKVYSVAIWSPDRLQIQGEGSPAVLRVK